MKQRQILTQAKEQAQVLSEANHKANRQIQLGAIALRVMLMGAIADLHTFPVASDRLGTCPEKRYQLSQPRSTPHNE